MGKVEDPTDFARQFNWMKFQVASSKGHIAQLRYSGVRDFLTPEAKDQLDKVVYHLDKLHRELYREGSYLKARSEFDRYMEKRRESL